jgi:hypothetical protein
MAAFVSPKHREGEEAVYRSASPYLLATTYPRAPKGYIGVNNAAATK